MFPLNPQSSNPLSYQVAPEDRDLLTLAEKLKTDYPTLVNLNPSITSISQGQFINIPGQQYNEPIGPNRPPAGLQYPAPIGPALPPVQGPKPPPTYGSPYIPSVPNHAQPITNLYPSNLNASGNPGSALANTMTDARAYQLSLTKQGMMNAADPSQWPNLLSTGDVSFMGFTPAQMTAAGFTMKNGNWVKGPTPGAVGQPTTNNNWQTNPSLHLVTFNKNAKNRQNRFVTTEKWARNAWKRKMREQRTAPAVEVRSDTPSTTLDLVLGK